MYKLRALFIMAAIILSTVALQGTAAAADKAQVLIQGSEKFEAFFYGVEGENNARKFNLLRDSGLTYQPTIVAPTKGVLSCKDQRQLSVLMGVYSFDRAYAMMFGRKDDALAYNQLICEDVPNRLKLGDKLKLKKFTPQEIKALSEQPDDQANRDLWIKYTVSNMHDFRELIKTDPQYAAIMVDWYYGIFTEGIYLACKLALGSGDGEKLVNMFNHMAARLDKMRQVIDTYAQDKELAELMDSSRRQETVKPILALIQGKNGLLTMDDLKQILAKLEPERARVVAACK